MSVAVDDDFRALGLTEIADAGLQRARDLGASHADVRVQRGRRGYLHVRDGNLASSTDSADLGVGVRVLVDGVWGFAAADLGPDAAAGAAERAVALAKVSAPLAGERVELADEPVHAGAEWVSAYQQDPFEVPLGERVGVLTELSGRLLGTGPVVHVEALVLVFKEQKFYADLAGSSTLQQRVMLFPQLTAVAVGPEGAETMRCLTPAAGRGWELMQGTGYDWDAEVDQLPELLAERVAAPSVEAGSYDLVIDPSNLALTIHESVGHATELDRALGYEAGYAGTSFATPDQLGTLRYGSPLMHVTGDRTIEHGCATVGFDDEGVATQQWDIVRDGVLVGYQLDRRMARQLDLGPSNGCAYGDSSASVAMQRMANVSLQPQPGGPSVEELIGGVERGLYVVGDKSWSIDMQRYNFQFTGQRFYRIEHGRLAGQVKDAAYTASTPRFWAALAGVGGPQTYRLGGFPNCGKGQPSQTAWVSHGAPAALFRGVTVLNTKEAAA